MFKSIILSFLVIENLFSYDLSFKYHHKDHLKIRKAEIYKGNIVIKEKNIKSQVVSLFDILFFQDKTYRGYPLFKILDAVYGAEWRKQRKITFIAGDGYRQNAKINLMLENSKEHQPFIVFQTGEGGTIPKLKKGKRQIEMGPYYLVWTKMTKENKKKLYKFLKWPYQLKTINIWPN